MIKDIYYKFSPNLSKIDPLFSFKLSNVGIIKVLGPAILKAYSFLFKNNKQKEEI